MGGKPEGMKSSKGSMLQFYIFLERVDVTCYYFYFLRGTRIALRYSRNPIAVPSELLYLIYMEQKRRNQELYYF